MLATKVPAGESVDREGEEDPPKSDANSTAVLYVGLREKTDTRTRRKGALQP